MVTKTKLPGKCYWCGTHVASTDNCCRACYTKTWEAPTLGPVPARLIHDAIHLRPNWKGKPPDKMSSPEDWLNWRTSQAIKEGEPKHECMCGEKHLTATRPAHSDWLVTPDKTPDKEKPRTETADTVTASCGHPARRPARGPLPRFCSDACRKRASRG